MRLATHIAVLLAVLAANALTHPSNIHPSLKYGWGENIGFLNWRDANGGESGVRMRSTFLEGFVWSENVGWINLGNGQPGDGVYYENHPSHAATFGVNIDPATGELFGMAWGENIGWVNFDMRVVLRPSNQQARFDFAAGRFRGYAWGENVGWIDLDDALKYVQYVPPMCNDPYADADGDQDVDQADYALVQRCITTIGVPPPDGCECYDRPEPGFPLGDRDVDLVDVGAFNECGSGPTILANLNCDD